MANGALMLVGVLAVMSLSSCVTLLDGTTTEVYVDGQVDEPVTIESSHAVYKDVTLPTVVEVKRRRLDGQHIQISSEHHSYDDIVLRKTFNEWSLASLLFSPTAFCVDWMTNCVSRPQYNQFFVKPAEKVMQTDSPRTSWQSATTVPCHMDINTINRLRNRKPPKFLRHELNTTFGFGNNQADHSTRRLVDAIIQPHDMEVEGGCGDIFGDSYLVAKIDYHYRLDRHWEVGATVGWGLSSESYSDDYFFYYEEKETELPAQTFYGYHHCRSFSVAPSVRYTWYERWALRMASRVAIGFNRRHFNFELTQNTRTTAEPPHQFEAQTELFDKKKWRFAYQISPLVLTIGSGHLRFITELGYGCYGVCNIGAIICF